jgi:3-hydroxyacyl-CoA dehydrogenase/enoyl-CoA hydratase/3-hydroxybutyryl-CoA epimerase
VIEAASEKLEIKKQIFRDIDSKIDDTDILSTNTSALSVSALAAETKLPGRVIGMHFFNPVSRMKLIEVVIGKQTSDDTKERTLAFSRQIGKLPVVVRDSPGFLVNRVLFPYLLEAAELFEQGVEAKKIDDALLEWGMPMGPLRLIDEVGVDITVDIASTLEKAFGPRAATPALLNKMREANLLGRKTGSGFYKYEGKQQLPNEAIEKWRQSASSLPATEFALRLVYLMVNEAARCLEEEVVATPEDADYGMILGTGFAPLRGGPLRFADYCGAAALVSLGEKQGGKFQPCDLLRQHAQEGTKFYEK